MDEEHIEEVLELLMHTMKKIVEGEILSLAAQTRMRYFTELQNQGFTEEQAFQLVLKFDNPIKAVH